jgi:hypothetical protein
LSFRGTRPAYGPKLISRFPWRATALARTMAHARKEEDGVTTEPPVVEDRRRNPDRRQGDRRADDTSRYLRMAASAAVAVCGGLSLVYLFFAALGAVDLEEALAATVVAVVMGLVWLAGYLVRHRQVTAATTDRVNRERRGF